MSAYTKPIVETAKAVDWKPLRPLMGDDARETYAYLAWLATGDKQYIGQALEATWRRITALFPMHTWAEQSADRVAVSKTLVDRLYLGGTPGKRNKLWPTHTVSWETRNEEFAAWVLQTTPTTLRVWLYNFEPRPQRSRMRTWGLEPGSYEVRLGPDGDGDERLDRSALTKTMDLSRNVPIELTLPARQLTLIEIRRQKESTPLFPRPDLAVVTTDMSYNAKTGVLEYVVHNVGSAAAKEISVVVRADKREVAQKTIPVLEAPNDLMPRTVRFSQTGLGNAKEIRVVVDPGNRVAEIWEENNEAVWNVK
jgi:hypothetical protein